MAEGHIPHLDYPLGASQLNLCICNKLIICFNLVFKLAQSREERCRTNATASITKTGIQVGKTSNVFRRSNYSKGSN